MKIDVIVQARMTSTRLPGKVLKILQGKTFLEHTMDRCRNFKGVSDVICATVGTASCAPIVELCRARGYQYFCGDEHDVLDRYFKAAQAARSDVIVRVTSDCPLVDPEIANEVIESLCRGECSIAATNLPPSWPLGMDVEAFRFDALERAWRDATLIYEREHVSPFIRTRPTTFRSVNVPCAREGRSHWRLTLDTPEDLLFFQELGFRIQNSVESLRWREIFDILDREPDLCEINVLPEYRRYNRGRES